MAEGSFVASKDVLRLLQRPTVHNISINQIYVYQVSRGRSSFCINHGGGKRCKVEGCRKQGLRKFDMLCRSHKDFSSQATEELKEPVSVGKSISLPMQVHPVPLSMPLPGTDLGGSYYLPCYPVGLPVNQYFPNLQFMRVPVYHNALPQIYPSDYGIFNSLMNNEQQDVVKDGADDDRRRAVDAMLQLSNPEGPTNKVRKRAASDMEFQSSKSSASSNDHIPAQSLPPNKLTMTESDRKFSNL
jgi:hypothetical protein